MAEPTKAEIAAERDRLRVENENLRYVCQRLLDASGCQTEASRHQGEGQRHLLDAIGVFTMPTIPNN